MPKPRKNVSVAQARQIVESYADGHGFKALGKHFGHCVAVIRRVLVDNKVKIRPVGRPGPDNK